MQENVLKKALKDCQTELKQSSDLNKLYKKSQDEVAKDVDSLMKELEHQQDKISEQREEIKNKKKEIKSLITKQIQQLEV